jgi:ABC-type uncharacterized transport system substrate-binding protein
MLRRLYFLLWSALLCLSGGVVHAQAKVVIVTSDSSTSYVQAAEVLTLELTRKGVAEADIMRMDVSEWGTGSARVAVPSIYVALGTAATQALAASSVSTPVLATLIPRDSFDRVLRNNGRKASADFTAIYLDQPLQRQFAMIRLALPRAKRMGVLWGADSRHKAPLLHSLATANGVLVNEAVLAGELDVYTDLKQVLGDSDLFLALADPQVFNTTTIQNILLTTIHAQVPVVAFSPAYVRAGALVALYATPEQVARQSATLVFAALHGRPLPHSPLETDDFEVSVNMNVARVLNLTLDGNAIRSALRQVEKLP